MNSRLTPLALVAVLLAAFAVPALAAPNEATPSVQSISTRALAKARLALLTARSAKSQSRTAARTANAAVNTANEAKGTATATQAVLNSTKVQSGLATGAVTTESESYVQLPGGPSAAVDVPASGLIEVWAQVTFKGAGAVALFEDGQRMAGQSKFCAPEEEGVGLLASLEGGGPEELTLSTPSSTEFIVPICGSLGPPAPVMFQTAPGHHVYELRYQFGECGCGPPGAPEVTFSNRLLRVAPRL